MSSKACCADRCGAELSIESLESRVLLSAAIWTPLAGTPLQGVINDIFEDVVEALPDDVEEAMAPVLQLLVDGADATYAYQAFPGEVNDVSVWGTLANTLLMTSESKDVPIFRVGTFTFEAVEKLGINVAGKVHAGGSFIAEIAGGLGLEVKGLDELILKQLISLPDASVVVSNRLALCSLFPQFEDILGAFNAFLDFSLSDLIPEEVTIIPPINLPSWLGGGTLWDGWTVTVPDWLQELPTLQDLVGDMLPDPLADVVYWLGDVVEWLQQDMGTDGIYISTLDGNDRVNLSTLTGIPQTVHGGAGHDFILSGGGQDLLASWGVPFRVGHTDRAVVLYGDDGNDTFVVNRNFDCRNLTVDGGTGNDLLLIQGSDASDIVRLIAGPDGVLEEIRFEIPNLQAGSPTNEVQRITLPEDVVGGSFVLRAEGYADTMKIFPDSSASWVQVALGNRAHDATGGEVGQDDFSVVKIDDGVWEIEFVGELAGTDFMLLVGDGSLLERHINAVVVSTDQDGGNGGGVPIANEVQEIRLPDSVTGGTFTLQFGTYAETVGLSYRAGANDVEYALLQTGMTRDDFEVTGGYGQPWEIEFTGNLAMTDVPDIVVDGSNLTGVLADWDLVTVQDGVDAVNAIYVLTVPDEADGGAFEVTVQVGTESRSAAVDYDVTAVELEQAMEDLGTVGAGNVDVTRDTDGSFRIEFIDDLAGEDQLLFLADGASLTGISTSEQTAGGGGANEVQEVALSGPAQDGSFRLTFEDQTTNAIATSATAAQIDAALEALSSIGTDNVQVTGTSATEWLVEFTGGLADTDVSLIDAQLVVGMTSEASGEDGQNEIQQLVLPAEVSGGTLRLVVTTPFGQNAAQVDYDIDAQGLEDALEALNVVGDGNVEVTEQLDGSFYIEFLGDLAATSIDPITADTRFLAGGAVVTVDASSPFIVNEVQMVTIPYTDAVIGTFQLEVDGYGTTADIDFGASAEDVQAALEAIVGAGNVEVTGEARAWEVEFIGALGGTDVDPMVVHGGDVDVTGAEVLVEEVTAGNSGGETVVLATTRFTDLANVERFDIEGAGGDDTLIVDTSMGPAYFLDGITFNGGAGLNHLVFEGGPVNERQEVSFDPDTVEDGYFILDFGDDETHALRHDVSAEDVQEALEDLPAIGAGNVLVRGEDGGPWTVEFIGAFAEQDVEQLSAWLAVYTPTGPDAPYTILVETLVDGGDPVRATWSEHKGGRCIMAFGDDPEDVQLVRYSSCRVVDFVAADEIRGRGSSEADTIEIDQDEYDGEVVGLIRLSEGPSRLYYANKDEVVIQGRGGDDLITVDLADLPVDVQALTIDAGPSTEGDALLINGTDQDDVFDYTPTSMKGGTLAVQMGGRDLAVELAGLESFRINAWEHDDLADTLIVNAPEATSEPDDFPGTGEVTPRSAAGLPRLPVGYVNMEDVDLRGLSVLCFEGSVGDDVIEVTPTQVIFVDIFGKQNITDIGDTEVVWLHLMGSNDEVTVTAPTPLQFQLEILGGGGDPGGDVLTFIGSGDKVDLDLADYSLVDGAGSHVTFWGMESFAIDTAGGQLAVATDQGDETLLITPHDDDAGRLLLDGSLLVIDYAGLAGQPVALDLADGQDTLIVAGSSVGDEVTVDATSVIFTDDGRSLTYDGTEAVTVDGLQGNDRLDVDNTAGLIALPGGVTYVGGSGIDTLRLTGTTAVDESTYIAGPGAGEGTVIHTLGDQQQFITFTGLEPVIDLVPGPLTVDGTGASDVINFDVGPNSGSGLVGGMESAQVSVGSFEPLEFAAKTSLTINGLAGDDTIDLNNALLPAELVLVTLDGGSGDDTLIGSAGDDVLLGGRGDDVLRGEGGDDVLDGGEGDNTLDGGLGGNTADFHLTDGADAVQAETGSVTVNGQQTLIWAFEMLLLDAMGGDDLVGVSATDGFVATVVILGGPGDDVFTIDLANPGPLTWITVDGGEHLSGDSATVTGAFGDDQFSAYGDTNVFGESRVDFENIEDAAVLEAQRIDTDRHTVEADEWWFTDADGNSARVEIGGGGTADVYRDLYNGRNADIHSIVLSGTSAGKTKLGVTVRDSAGTDNETAIGSLTGTGLRSLKAPDSDVTEGIWLPEGLRNLVVDDVYDGAEIVLGGLSGENLYVTADEVGDANLITSRYLRKLKVGSWEDGLVQAAIIGSVKTTHGGFGANLVNTRRNPNEYGIKSISVSDGDLVSSITADRVGSIQVRGGDAALSVTLMSDAAALHGRPAIGKMSIIGGDLLGATFDLRSGTELGKLSVRARDGEGGNAIGAIATTGGVRRASISGGLLGSFETGGDVGALTVGGDVSADVTVGGSASKLDLRGAVLPGSSMAVGGSVSRLKVRGDLTGSQITVAGLLRKMDVYGEYRDSDLLAGALGKVKVRGDVASTDATDDLIQALAGSFYLYEGGTKHEVVDASGIWLDGVHACVG